MAHCNGVAFCNCGVAALAGQDVFYIDYCDGGVDIDYKSCGDKILKVKSYKELKYEVKYILTDKRNATTKIKVVLFKQ